MGAISGSALTSAGAAGSREIQTCRGEAGERVNSASGSSPATSKVGEHPAPSARLQVGGSQEKFAARRWRRTATCENDQYEARSARRRRSLPLRPTGAQSAIARLRRRSPTLAMNERPATISIAREVAGVADRSTMRSRRGRGRLRRCRSHGRAGSAMVNETCLRCCAGISSATTRALLCAGCRAPSPRPRPTALHRHPRRQLRSDKRQLQPLGQCS